VELFIVIPPVIASEWNERGNLSFKC